MKKREMPSIPKLKFRFKKGIHNNLLTNWNVPIDLLKKTHKNKESTNKKQDTFKAITFKSEWLGAGTNNKKKVPSKGNTKIDISKLAIFIEKKSNIYILQGLNLYLPF